MSLMSLSCAYALQLAACAVPDTAPPAPTSIFGTVAVADRELSTVRGLGTPEAGLDEVGPATRARSVEIAAFAQRTSDQTRELVDNWNVAVAAPLIAEATAAARS